MADEGIHVLLRDGTPVFLRPIVPDDKDLLVKALERLSEESRYRRFMSLMTGFTTDQLRRLTEIDHRKAFAWIALHAEDPEEPLGVARYVRLPDRPESAEVAVAVMDEYQRKGLGTILLEVLAATARAAGIRRFAGHLLADNVPMRRMLGRIGAELRLESPGVLEVDIPLDRVEEWSPRSEP